MTTSHLDNNQLTGSIPTELGSLANLQHLYLNGNQLTGSISAELGGLVNLQQLFLYSNQLTGSIPAELGSLTNLQHLYLNSNQLTGSIPAELGSLANLQYLYLYGNQLTGSIPVELSSLVNLRALYLYGNQLTGSIPAEIGNLVNLSWLSLSDNQLSGSIPVELSSLANLQELYLYGNQLSGSIPAELGNLTNLVILRLDYNLLTGSIPPQLGSLLNLYGLELQGNQLTGAIPNELGNLANLAWLHLEGNQLSGGIPPQLGGLVSLQALYLSGNQLTGAIPSELGNLASLQDLYLYGNQLTGSIPAELGGLANLQYLYLNDNQLTGSIPAELGRLVNLLTLSLSNNQLSGSIPAELGGLTSLQQLYLFSNQLSGSIPSELGNLTNLVVLRLDYNLLTGSIPPQLGSLLNLYGLELQGNQLTGAIPNELGNLVNLAWLYLWDNQLTGGIPSALGNLNGLLDFRASSNQLSGSIPPALGELTNLQVLILSANQLDGILPPELGNLVNLQTLWLDGNQLSGHLPIELGNLSNLQTLLINSNPLNGALPTSLASLSILDTFWFNETQLCVPADQSVRDWLAAIPNVVGTGADCIDLAPGIVLTKFTNGQDVTQAPGPLLRSGDEAIWTFRIANIGNITLTQLALTDNREGVVTDCSPTPLSSLAPGAETLCSTTGTVQAGQYMNTANVTGTATAGLLQTVSASDSSYYFGMAPSIALTKYTNGQDVPNAPGLYLRVGETVTWTYRITNTGNVALTNLGLTDNKEGAITSCSPALSGGLAPDDSTHCTMMGAVHVGQYANMATVSGSTPVGQPPATVSASDSSFYFGSASTIAASVFPAVARVGDEVTFTLVITSRVANQPLTLDVIDRLPQAFKLVAGSASSPEINLDHDRNEVHWRHTTTPFNSSRVTITYRAILTTGCITTVANHAEMFENSSQQATAEAAAMVSLAPGEICTVNLPVVQKPLEPLPVLVNGFFDAGPGVGWTELVNSQTSRLIYHRSESNITPASGDWYAWLGGKDNQLNQLSQHLPFALPSQYETKLQYRFWSVSQESSCANDWAEIRVSGSVLLRYNLCAQNNTAPAGSAYGWRLSTPISLDAFRGETVLVEFVTSLNGSRNSNFFIEDVVICSDFPEVPGPRCQSATGAANQSDNPTPGADSNAVTNDAPGAIEK